MSTIVRSHQLAAKITLPRFHSFVLGLFGFILAVFAQKQLYSGATGGATLFYALALFCFISDRKSVV